MAKKTNKNTVKMDVQTKLTVLLATVVLFINCYALSSSFVNTFYNNGYIVEETDK